MTRLLDGCSKQSGGGAVITDDGLFEVKITAQIEFGFDDIKATTISDAGVVAGNRGRRWSTPGRYPSRHRNYLRPDDA
jgi:hypothetical protein